MSPSDEKLPLISIITPSYQQGAFIKETIDSVLSQDYPHIEHIVVDGGSTDETVSILKKYAKNYSGKFRYVSEKDNGQSNAINKGFAMASGSLIGWLNSDDTYLPRAISRAVDMLRKNPEFGAVYGKANHTDRDNKLLQPYPVEPGITNRRLFDVCTICQPAVFMRKSVLDQVGYVDEKLHFCMDYELWIRISKKSRFGFVDKVLANSRLHDECKSVTQYYSVGIPEIIRCSLKHYGKVSNHWLIQYIANFLPQGPVWLMERLTHYGAFGKGPRIVESNRFEDGWAPPRWSFTVANDGTEKVKSVVIQGEHTLPKMAGRQHVGELQLTVRVDGQIVRVVKQGAGSFVLDVPLDGKAGSYKFEIQANRSFVPAQMNMNNDRRELSFRVKGAAALTPFQLQLYNELDDNPAGVGHWLVAHHK